jgi:uncharacterized membrane protein
MATPNPVIARQSQHALAGKWGLAIGTFVVYTLVNAGAGAIPFISLLIGGPMSFGAALFSLSISRGKEAKLEQIFDGFKYFSNTLVAYLLMILYILLWMLLLIIPGIIAALSYSMTFYILVDEPTLKPKEALDKSKAMMDGYKWKLFYLGLRFFLLALLCILTLGIGFLWLIPYINVTMAVFYDDLKNQNSVPDVIDQV